MAAGRNSPKLTSTIGRRPNSAAPMAAPTMPDSEIGAWRTRRGPNSSNRPRAPCIERFASALHGRLDLGLHLGVDLLQLGQAGLAPLQQPRRVQVERVLQVV